MGANFIKVCTLAFGISSIAVLGYSANSYYMKHFDKIISDTAKTYYEAGFDHGKVKTLEDVKVTYQKILEHLDSYNETNKNSVEHFILTEKRINKIMEKSNPNLSDSTKKKYITYIMKWSNEYNLSPIFVASIIHRETNFRENLVSSAGAKGCMQVVPKWHKDKIKALGITEKDLSNINHGINIGCQVIKEYLEGAEYNYRKALLKYVGSVNNPAESYVNDIFEMTLYAYSINE